MGARRPAKAAEAQRKWQRFLQRHATLLTQANLPELITESQDHWDDFLMHGHLDHHGDPSGFTVASLSADQREALKQLAGDYLAEFGADYTPLALRWRASGSQAT